MWPCRCGLKCRQKRISEDYLRSVANIADIKAVFCYILLDVGIFPWISKVIPTCVLLKGPCSNKLIDLRFWGHKQASTINCSPGWPQSKRHQYQYCYAIRFTPITVSIDNMWNVWMWPFIQRQSSHNFFTNMPLRFLLNRYVSITLSYIVPVAWYCQKILYWGVKKHLLYLPFVNSSLVTVAKKVELNFTHTYWQISLSEQNQHCTFRTKLLPLGLKTAP